MAECWWMMGEGKLDIYARWFELKNERKRCNFCARIAFDKGLKIEEIEESKIEEETIEPDIKEITANEETNETDDTKNNQEKEDEKSIEIENTVLEAIKQIEGDDGAPWDTITEKCEKAGLDKECVEHTEGATVKYHIFTQHPSGSAPQDSLKISLNFEKLGLKDTYIVRDLWAKKDLGEYSDEISFYVRNHGSRLVRISGVE